MPRGVAKAKDGVEKKGKEVGKVVVGKRSRKMRGGDGGAFGKYCKLFIEKNLTSFNDYKSYIKEKFKKIKEIIDANEKNKTKIFGFQTKRFKSDTRKEQEIIITDINLMINDSENNKYLFDKITPEKLISVLKYINEDFILVDRKTTYEKNGINNDILQTLYKNLFFLKIYKLFEEFANISEKTEISFDIQIATEKGDNGSKGIDRDDSNSSDKSQTGRNKGDVNKRTGVSEENETNPDALQKGTDNVPIKRTRTIFDNGWDLEDKRPDIDSPAIYDEKTIDLKIDEAFEISDREKYEKWRYDIDALETHQSINSQIEDYGKTIKDTIITKFFIIRKERVRDLTRETNTNIEVINKTILELEKMDFEKSKDLIIKSVRNMLTNTKDISHVSELIEYASVLGKNQRDKSLAILYKKSAYLELQKQPPSFTQRGVVDPPPKIKAVNEPVNYDKDTTSGKIEAVKNALLEETNYNIILEYYNTFKNNIDDEYYFKKKIYLILFSTFENAQKLLNEGNIDKIQECILDLKSEIFKELIPAIINKINTFTFDALKKKEMIKTIKDAVVLTLRYNSMVKDILEKHIIFLKLSNGDSGDARKKTREDITDDEGDNGTTNNLQKNTTKIKKEEQIEKINTEIRLYKEGINNAINAALNEYAKARDNGGKELFATYKTFAEEKIKGVSETPIKILNASKYSGIKEDIDTHIDAMTSFIIDLESEIKQKKEDVEKFNTKIISLRKDAIGLFTLILANVRALNKFCIDTLHWVLQEKKIYGWISGGGQSRGKPAKKPKPNEPTNKLTKTPKPKEPKPTAKTPIAKKPTKK